MSIERLINRAQEMNFLDLLLVSYDVHYVSVHSQVLIMIFKEAEGTEWSSFSGTVTMVVM